MTSLTAEDVLRWNETTTQNWRKLLERHPEALGVACDVREGSTVADLLQHVVAVELRYAERLGDEAITDYANVAKGSIDEIFATHDLAMAKFRALAGDADYDWEAEIEMATRSMGTLIATRKTVLFHALMHSIRHYAQLATLLRHAGIVADFQMDYLMMGARRG